MSSLFLIILVPTPKQNAFQLAFFSWSVVSLIIIKTKNKNLLYRLIKTK